jgi:hypothetical protein
VFLLAGATSFVLRRGCFGKSRQETTLPTPDDEQDQVVDLDVSWLVPADLCAVDALARLQVAAARRGCWLELHGADGGLVELIDFIGLGGVVHLCPRCSSSPLGSKGLGRGT